MKKKILIGVIIVLAAAVFYGLVWIYTGEPSVKVNYVKKLNEMSRPEGGQMRRTPRSTTKRLSIFILSRTKR